MAGDNWIALLAKPSAFSWNVIRERAKKITHNYAVKIEVSTGRDEYVKVRKNSCKAYTLSRFGPISIDGNRWGVHLCMLQSRASKFRREVGSFNQLRQE